MLIRLPASGSPDAQRGVETATVWWIPIRPSGEGVGELGCDGADNFCQKGLNHRLGEVRVQSQYLNEFMG